VGLAPSNVRGWRGVARFVERAPAASAGTYTYLRLKRVWGRAAALRFAGPSALLNYAISLPAPVEARTIAREGAPAISDAFAGSLFPGFSALASGAGRPHPLPATGRRRRFFVARPALDSIRKEQSALDSAGRQRHPVY
jgi:hypothetical protein